MKILTTLIFVLMSFALVQGQEVKKPAEKLLDLMKFKEKMKSVSSASFKPFLDKLRQQGVPEAGVKEVAAAADAYFEKVASDPDYTKAMIALYEKEFTAEELKDMVAFYQTTAGQKALHKMPVLSQSGAKMGEKFALKHQAGFKEQMTRIMQKYKPAPGGG